ncbi:hypothetical protein ABD72_21760 [Brevibacillus laterosporus]|nr:hypothetical protein [Brevibacillus laterosporus]TPH23073.1 hypothetical protein EGH09_00790 [Brevibacillus laterosporus]
MLFLLKYSGFTLNNWEVLGKSRVNKIFLRDRMYLYLLDKAHAILKNKTTNKKMRESFEKLSNLII